MIISEKATFIERLQMLQEVITDMQKTAIRNHIIKPICGSCHQQMIQFDSGIEPPVCENPICVLNNYQPKR